MDAAVIALGGSPAFISCIQCLPQAVILTKEDMQDGRFRLNIQLQGEPGPQKPKSNLVLANRIPTKTDLELINKFKQQNAPQRIILKK